MAEALLARAHCAVINACGQSGGEKQSVAAQPRRGGKTKFGVKLALLVICQDTVPAPHHRFLLDHSQTWKM